MNQTLRRLKCLGFGVLFYFLSFTSLWASSSWERVTIPGATCGDGAPYHVFIRRGDPEKLSIDFMGGGACWNFLTCIGPTPHTWIHGIPFMIPSTGILSTDPKVSVLWDYTHLFFPYCTGDVFLGNHTAKYFGGAKVHHMGISNVELTLAFLKNEELFPFAEAKKVVVQGSSAGALAALGHLKKIDSYLPVEADRVLIADAPGMHFGERFWKKFTPRLIQDFQKAFKEMGIFLNPLSGHLAAQMPKICQQFSHWRIGFLQGSRDVIMSSIFGNISPWDHEQMVYGKEGIYQETMDPTDNCSAWVPKTKFHTFLLHHIPMNISIMGKTANHYVRDVVNGVQNSNYQGSVERGWFRFWGTKDEVTKASFVPDAE